MTDLESFLANLDEHLKDRGGSPPGSWVVAQNWCNCLFASYPVPAATLRPLVPDALELDLYDGKAWLTLIPFRMRRLHLKWLPPIPFTSDFPEINCRVYVRAPATPPAVYFFSIDAASWLGAIVARLFFKLPYFSADMSLAEAEGGFALTSDRRAQRGSPGADLSATWQPQGEAFAPVEGSLEYFLLERYNYFSSRGGTLWGADLRHPDWSLQRVEAEVSINTIPQASGIDLGDSQPHFAYARETHSVLWAPRRFR